MSSSAEIQKSMKKYINDLDKLAKANAKLKNQARLDANENIEYNYKVDKVFKPFVENLDKTLIPIKENVANVSRELIPLKSGIDLVNNELFPMKTEIEKTRALAQDLHQDFEDYNKQLKTVHDHNQEQLAIESIPEKYYSVIGQVAKTYLANRDKNDSLGLRWDEEEELFKIGLYPVEIDTNSNLSIHMPPAPQIVTGTEGLWKLLTQKNPYKPGEPRIKWIAEVPSKDIDTYARLMYYTKACYKEGRNGLVKRSSTASKWNEIIKPYLEKKEAEKSLQRSNSTGHGIKGSGLTIIENDTQKLTHKLWVILGNIRAGHTNISNEDVQIASEILEIIKETISPMTYNNIASTISHFIASKR